MSNEAHAASQATRHRQSSECVRGQWTEENAHFRKSSHVMRGVKCSPLGMAAVHRLLFAPLSTHFAVQCPRLKCRIPIRSALLTRAGVTRGPIQAFR